MSAISTAANGPTEAQSVTPAIGVFIFNVSRQALRTDYARRWQICERTAEAVDLDAGRGKPQRSGPSASR